MLILATAMYPKFTKIPGLVRVNRLLQVPAAPSILAFSAYASCDLGCMERREPVYQSHIRLAFGHMVPVHLTSSNSLNCKFSIFFREEQVMKCVEECPYPVLHVRPKSRPPTPDPYGAAPNIKKQKKLDKIAVKQSIRVPEPKQGLPLRTLDLSKNGISCQGFSAFLSCLARRRIQDTLLALDVSRTKIAVAGGRVLSQFLSSCLFIQKLDCRYLARLFCELFSFVIITLQPHANGRQFPPRIFPGHAQQRP
jgi:hypothetical protein